MADSSEVKILVVAEAAAARRWAEALQGRETRVWLERGGMTPDQVPEVILTDSADFEADQTGDVGVIRIGADGEADLHLPADCTTRELQLACQLLAQIVRLRRRERWAAEVHKKLSVAALTDSLTGLPNRRAWDAALADRLELATSSRRRFCLAILDIDHFKRINDTLGHAVGDEVLRESGRAVYDSLRHDDFVARLGGDEFGLLLWVPNEAVAATVVERARAALPSRLARTAAPGTTASAGYRVWSCQPESRDVASPPSSGANGLYTAADAALREAKRRGRNQTVGG